jgi:hypothetical protein
MKIGQILLLALFAVAAAVPVVITVWNIRRVIKKKLSFKFELITFIIGMILTAVAYGLSEPVYYKEALNSNLGPVFHEAFNRYHIITLITLWLISLIFYFILKFYQKGFPPIVEAVLLAGLYTGIIISAAAVIQLTSAYKADFAEIILVSYMYLFFFNYFVLTINLLVLIVRKKAAGFKDITYKNVILQSLSQLLIKGANRFIAGVVFMLPFLVVLIFFLTLFGQEPDSVIKAFTQTSDWLLSTQVSPPPIASGGHYLCTVSLRGHRKIVKPLRYGVRNGQKIVVNRQLCVANAFEQLIMEKAPGFHRRVRNFYDTYGLPVSKVIRKAWTADFIYLLMKPLEWLFLIVLYTFDPKPENRIARQYLPKVK